MSVVALSCPSCGGPLSIRFREVGHERCSYCDVISVYERQEACLESGAPPTVAERSIGLIKRHGTIALAPFLGWTACTLLELQRFMSHSSSNVVELTIIIGVIIVALMLLGRWLVAGIWTLFFCLSLVSARAFAFHEVGAVSHFSWTSEVSIMPMSIALGVGTAFALFFATKGDLAHEQQKLTWRTSVAVMFLVGLLGGLRYHSQPYSGEVYTAWSWAYGEEMQRLTHLARDLPEGAVLTKSANNTEQPVSTTSPKAHWVDGDPAASNVVFLPLPAIAQFPEPKFFLLKPPQTLWLMGGYSHNFGYVAETVSDRAYFSPQVAPKDWRMRIDAPLRAYWLVIYDHDPALRRQRFWLVRRRGEGELTPSGRPLVKLRVAGYDETTWPTPMEDGDISRERRWLLESLANLTGGEFKTSR